MTEAPFSYGEFLEISKRPEFDPECGITLSNFKALVAETHVKADLVCQLEINGSRCNQQHNNGWLARTTDGKEGLIGRNCGNKYLQASEVFAAEKNRISQELRIASHIAVLSDLLANKAAMLTRWSSAHQRLLGARRAIREYEDQLPSAICTMLRDMAKRRSSTVYVEVKRVEVEKDSEGKEREKVYWDRQSIRSIGGLDAWDSSATVYLFPKLEEIESAIFCAKSERGIKESQLRKWREILEEFPHCEDVLTDLERAISDFTALPNLILLCHLIKGDENQIQIARAILRGALKTKPTDTKARDIVLQAQSLVRQQFNERDFRVA